MNKLDEQAQLAIAVMYERLPNYNKVAEHFGVAPSTVWNYINYWGKSNRLRGIRKVYRERNVSANGCNLYSEYIKRRIKIRQKRNRIFCGLIRDVLAEKGRDQNWLADSIGITKQAISQIINGKTRLGRERLPRLVHALGINLETLINIGGYKIRCSTS